MLSLILALVMLGSLLELANCDEFEVDVWVVIGTVIEVVEDSANVESSFKDKELSLS